MQLAQTNSMTKTQKIGLMALTMIACLVTLMPEMASAGTGGAAFDDVWIWLKDNVQGTGGRIACILIVVIGVFGGMRAGNTGGGFVTGLLTAIGLYNTPPVAESMISATVPYASVALEAIKLSNGL